MFVTVLGKSPAWQDAGGACSGYLVRQGRLNLMLDCGNGVFAKLRSACEYADVDAVLITHMHADHFFDLIPYAYALRHGPRRARPRLHLPGGGLALLRRVVAELGAADLIDTAFAASEYAPGETLELGPLRALMRPVPHYVPTCAVRLAGGGATLAYSADCRANEALVDLARDADLLVIEATLQSHERDGRGGHLTAREAGEHGARAGARRVVLTHFSDELDPARVRAEGSAGYGGEVELAGEGAVYEI